VTRRAPTLSDPLQELLRVQKRMNDLCETAMSRTDFEAPSGLNAWCPVGDVFETAEEVGVCLELPGMEQSAIDVRMEGEDLVVEGARERDGEESAEQFHRVERAYGNFSRRFHLPPDVDRSKVQATYRQGLLVVKLPKKSPSAPGAVRITIQ